MPDNQRQYEQLKALAWAAILLGLAAIIAAIVAIDNSNNATKKVQGQDTKINEINKEVKLLDRPAASPAGAGTNSGTQVVPNGSGQ